MFKKILSYSLFALTTLSSFVFAEIDYEIQDIGTLQTHSSQAIAINNDGQILGWYNIDGSANGKHFFVRDRDGSFHEIQSNENGNGNGPAIDWRYLKDNGSAYGTFDLNANVRVLCVWNKEDGFSKLGALPWKNILAINNSGQVLLQSQSEDGKQIQRPIIWHNGIITKLRGLEGDLGIESEESFGFDMNNHGDVVGYSIVLVSYKNNLYKQMHAAKWINGQAIDLHKKIPRTIKENIGDKSSLEKINDNGDVLFSNRLLLDVEGNLTRCRIGVSGMNNNYTWGITEVYNKQNKQVISTCELNKKAQNDFDSIWMSISKIIDVNDNGEIIAQGNTVYGEHHIILLTPKLDGNSDNTVSLETVLSNKIESSLAYYTIDIEKKVRLYFLECHSKNQRTAKTLSENYRDVLMLEAVDNVLFEIENLHNTVLCDSLLFLETANIVLKEKLSFAIQKIDAFISHKKSSL